MEGNKSSKRPPAAQPVAMSLISRDLSLESHWPPNERRQRFVAAVLFCFQVVLLPHRVASAAQKSRAWRQGELPSCTMPVPCATCRVLCWMCSVLRHVSCAKELGAVPRAVCHAMCCVLGLVPCCVLCHGLPAVCHALCAMRCADVLFALHYLPCTTCCMPCAVYHALCAMCCVLFAMCYVPCAVRCVPHAMRCMPCSMRSATAVRPKPCPMCPHWGCVPWQCAVTGLVLVAVPACCGCVPVPEQCCGAWGCY